MDIDLNTLLVALMFVTILSMGIGNILTSLADIFNHATPSRRGKIHVSWIFLLLIIHFNLFWQTKEILNVDNWQFGGFLLAMAGPVLMFFASSILLTAPPEDVQPDLDSFFGALGRRFFLMFAVLQGWVIMVGFAMTGAFVITDLTNAGFIVLAVSLALIDNKRFHTLGAFAAWGLGLAGFALRWIVK
jgi:hypothetical protein